MAQDDPERLKMVPGSVPPEVRGAINRNDQSVIDAWIARRQDALNQFNQEITALGPLEQYTAQSPRPLKTRELVDLF